MASIISLWCDSNRLAWHIPKLFDKIDWCDLEVYLCQCILVEKNAIQEGGENLKSWWGTRYRSFWVELDEHHILGKEKWILATEITISRKSKKRANNSTSTLKFIMVKFKNIFDSSSPNIKLSKMVTWSNVQSIYLNNESGGWQIKLWCKLHKWSRSYEIQQVFAE